MSDYNGPAELVFASVTHNGIAELNRTANGWEGWFELGPGSEISVETWRDLMMADSTPFSGWPAAIKIPGKTPRPTDVNGGDKRIIVAGDGAPPWEDEGK